MIHPVAQTPVCPGTYRNLEKLLNSWFIIQTVSSQELHLDSVAVDLTVISLWPSVESRLKMLDIITVRVSTTSTVNVCSHSDKESYKNLGQSESRWLNWSCSCSNTITHYWHTETNTATTHELKTELWLKSAPLDCDLSCAVTSDPATLGATPKMNMLRFHFLCLIVLK